LVSPLPVGVVSTTPVLVLPSITTCEERLSPGVSRRSAVEMVQSKVNVRSGRDASAALAECGRSTAIRTRGRAHGAPWATVR